MPSRARRFPQTVLRPERPGGARSSPPTHIVHLDALAVVRRVRFDAVVMDRAAVAGIRSTLPAATGAGPVLRAVGGPVSPGQVQGMLARVAEDPSIDCLVIHKLDRLARNLDDHPVRFASVAGR
jgi:hypothetical protein